MASSYPGAIDSAATLYSPVDAFASRPLATTATQQILMGDSTISVGSTDGFAPSRGILSVDDELIVYTAKTATQFTGCQRGAFDTVAAQHSSGVAVKANMVSGFITALQSAVVAIETELGTVAARNYVRKDGAVTVTGLKTFQDGAEFGSGTKAGSGLVRLPNTGAIRWRNAGDTADFGITLNASDHLVLDTIVEFASGQTFGAFAYPDATTSTKGIVQIAATGGLSIASGVLSLAVTGVPAGTYKKVTVDANGRVTAGVTNLSASDIPTHTHLVGDITSGVFSLGRGGTGSDLSSTGPGFLKQAAAGAVVTVVALVADDLPAHVHTSAQISDATANATANTVVLRDSSGGASFAYAAANNLWAYLASHLQSLESGAYQTVGGPYENMAKYSEDFTVATWDKNGGSCTVTGNAVTAPDGNATADEIAASTTTPVLQQNVAGLVDGGTYTFYIWARVASGTRKVSIAIVNNSYGAYLAGPTQVTLTAAWQRFKITATLDSGQTALWIVVRQYDSNGDDWTTGSIYIWGACLQQGNDPKTGYARTWGFQTSAVSAGVACGPLMVSAFNSSDSPFKVRGPGSNLADHTLLEVTATGELIVASGSGNGYRFAEIVGASNPSGWSGMLKVKNPAGVTAGYILLYSNP